MEATPVELVCGECGGLGWLRLDVPIEDPHFGEMVPCECMSEEFNRRLERVSQLSPEMLTWRLDQFKQRKGRKLGNVVPSLREALQTGCGWVTLSGPPGTGKTFLLAALANEARLGKRVAIYTTMADLLDDLRQCFDPKAEVGFSQLFNSVLDAQVLCLDEIEKFSTTAWAEEKFFQLVDHRYRNWNQALTVLATNRQIGLDKTILDSTRYSGYLESRIMDGRFWQIDEFWQVSDARPALKEQQP